MHQSLTSVTSLVAGDPVVIAVQAGPVAGITLIHRGDAGGLRLCAVRVVRAGRLLRILLRPLGRFFGLSGLVLNGLLRGLSRCRGLSRGGRRRSTGRSGSLGGVIVDRQRDRLVRRNPLAGRRVLRGHGPVARVPYGILAIRIRVTRTTGQPGLLECDCRGVALHTDDVRDLDHDRGRGSRGSGAR